MVSLLSSALPFTDPLAVSAVASLFLLSLSGQFDNHFWRIVLLVVQCIVMPTGQGDDIGISKSSPGFNRFLGGVLYVLTSAGIWWMPHFANTLRKWRPKRGCIFVTGCDSGMGLTTVVDLARAQRPSRSKSSDGVYEQIFAGCYNPKATKELLAAVLMADELESVTIVQLDVTNDHSVMDAAKTVQDWITSRPDSAGLTGIVQYHGVAYNGPASYMPVTMYQTQIDVNFTGTVRVIQNFMPLMRARTDPKTYRGRIVVTGTGGGPCTPCPPLLTAYMASKFALEAYTQAFRQELAMLDLNIDACVINPGFVKPTMLMAEGIKLTDKMWATCEKTLGTTQAKDEYGAMMDHFLKYSSLQPGTHVSKVVEATTHALLSNVPRSSYKVGIDSKVAPIVGMMPTGMREWIARNGIYGILSPAGTVQGYKL